MALVQRHAVRLAHAVDHFDLQRNDGHGRPGLGQQLQRAVEQCVIENGAVQLGIARRCSSGWCSDNGRHRCAQLGRGQRGQGVGVVAEGVSLRGVNAQLAAQVGQKAALGRALLAVSVAHAHGHFKGELAVAGVRQAGDHCVEREAFEQHVLNQPGHMRRARFSGQGLGNAADFLALGVGFVAVGKGGKQGDA